jgi:hypothetical protein
MDPRHSPVRWFAAPARRCVGSRAGLPSPAPRRTAVRLTPAAGSRGAGPRCPSVCRRSAGPKVLRRDGAVSARLIARPVVRSGVEIFECETVQNHGSQFCIDVQLLRSGLCGTWASASASTWNQFCFKLKSRQPRLPDRKAYCIWSVNLQVHDVLQAYLVHLLNFLLFFFLQAGR